MEIPTRQKCKKKKTRKNLDEIRRRSRIEVKDNVSSIKNMLKLHNLSKSKINNQLTSKRLTLTFFNNMIKSKTITRPPVEKIDQRDTHIPQIVLYKQSLKLNVASSPSVGTLENIQVSCNTCNAHTECEGKTKKNYIDVHTSPGSVILFSPLNNKHDKSECDKSVTGEQKDTLEDLLLISSSSCSTSDESANCFYEKFMNVLPNLIKRKFPALTKEVAANKNMTHLKKIYLNNIQNIENSNTPLSREAAWPLGAEHVSHEVTKQTTKYYPNTIIENPMDYIQKGVLWQSLRDKPESLLSSNSRLASPHLKLNFSNVDNNDSPEYIYFPHKLNE